MNSPTGRRYGFDHGQHPVAGANRAALHGGMRLPPHRLPSHFLPPLLLLLAALAGCATPPPLVAVAPPLAYPPSVRERIFAVLDSEWREWGALTLEAEAPPPPEPAEALVANFPRVLAYWRAVPDDEGTILRNRALYPLALRGEAPGGGLWRETPWSAAFISYVMLRAGVDTREFRPSAAHAFYIDHLLQDAATFPAEAPFLPHGPAEYAPRPGDLVCADRGRQPLTHWTQRASDQGRFRPMHCDIVVAVAPGVVEATGGNVADAVTRRRFAADAAGLLLPAPAATAAWFVVFENRLGRLGPWAPAF